jgi:DNA-binding GntR family transcriptional regulator
MRRRWTRRASSGRATTPDLQKTRVYRQLLAELICGDFPPGGVLEEPLLAKRYRAGRAAVRDALFRLSLEGFVNRWPRVGTTVADLGVVELQQVYEARVLIEGHCAALAARHATHEDIAFLRRAYRGVDEVLRKRDFRTLTAMDQAFHQGLAQASQNEYLARIVPLLHNHALRLRHRLLPRASVRTIQTDLANHEAVIEAIERQDPAGAEQAMRATLRAFPERLQHADVLRSHLDGDAAPLRRR